MVVVAVLLSLLTVLWIYFLWSRRRFYLFALKMPGPIGLPFIGIAHHIFNISDVLYTLADYTSENNCKTIFSWLGIEPVLYTIDPKVAEIVLNSPDCLNKGKVYEILTDIIGDGLITSKCPRWNMHRKLLNHCFAHKVLLELFPDFNKLAHQLCEKLDEHVNCGEIDVNDHIVKATLQSILAIAMEIDFKQESDMIFQQHFERMVDIATQRALKPWLGNSTIFRLTSMYKPFMESHEFIGKYVQEVVTRKLSENKTKAKDVSEDIQRPKKTFIHQAIKYYQENEFTLDDILHEANTIIIAGFETVATTLFSTLMCLAMHPKYQELVFEEISSVFPKKDFEVTYEDLQNLVYLDMCINETMRTTAIVPLIMREATDDIPISKDIQIPKGTQVCVGILNIHRDKDIWGPDANSFNPDHFLKSNLADKHKYSFLPFSKGSRNCAGWQYAGMVLKVVLAQVLRKYRFSTSFPFDDLRFVFHGTLRYQILPHLEIQRR